jgi:hypothetical protein
MLDNNGIKTWKYTPKGTKEDPYKNVIIKVQKISNNYL